MVETLQVGIIGGSAARGWAKISHVPAVRQVGGLTLGAVVTRDQRSADKAAEAFGAKKGYGDAKALFADPDIDIVTVTVNVPAHRDLVLGALAAASTSTARRMDQVHGSGPLFKWSPPPLEQREGLAPQG